MRKKKEIRHVDNRDPPFAVRLSVEFREMLDVWRATQDEEISRGEAIRRLVVAGVKQHKEMMSR